MEKLQLQTIFVENQEYISKITLQKRDFKFEPNGNYVIIGIRGAGKSYLMYQRIKELISNGTPLESIIYINFEDERFIGTTAQDLDNIKQAFEESHNLKPIFFLDEVQIISGWEKFVRRLADKGYRVYVTGSNAKMLSSEISTTLGGRFLTINVYPFSFYEHLSFNKIVLNSNWEYSPSKKNEVVRNFDTYFYYGGFPELKLFVNKREWLSNLYNKIFFGDLVARYSIRNSNSLKILIKKLAESIMQPSSYNRLKNIISSAGVKIGVETIIDYISYLKETLIVFEVKNYASSFAEKESSKKYYFLDNGILGLFIFNPDTILLENLVAITLYKKYGEMLYFYNKNIEIDFYVPTEGLIIQVSYDISAHSTREREVGAIKKTCKYLKASSCMIITRNQEETIFEDEIEIHVVPIWKWLLNI